MAFRASKMLSDANSSFDCIIVGAGWSGIWSALKLSQASRRVLLIEARKRIGGRAFTHTWDSSVTMDNIDRTLTTSPSAAAGQRPVHAVDFGCSFIHGYNEGNPVAEIAKRFGVQAHIPKPTTSQIVGPDGVLSSSLSDRLFANLDAAQAAAKRQGKDLRSQAASSDLSLRSAVVADSKSPLYDNLSSEQEKTLASGLAQSLHVPLGVEMDKVALQYFGHEANFAGTDAMPQGGFSLLIDKIAEEIVKNGGRIVLGQTVQKIQQVEQAAASQSKDAVRIVARSDDEQSKETQYAAQTAIVTVPLAVLKTHLDIFDPALEADRQDAIRRTNVGSLNKVLLTYEQPWWQQDVGTFFVLPEQGVSSDADSATLEDIFGSTTLIVSSLCAPNGLPSSMQTTALLVMVGAKQGKQLESHDRVKVAEALHAYLLRRLTTTSGSSGHVDPPRHAFYSRWSRQPFTGGATTTPVTIGNSPADFETIARPAWNGRLFFAGEHCEANHRGSIAGAVVSADVTSDAILSHFSSAGRSAM